MSMDDYKKHTSKPAKPDFDCHKCPETGGAYQELPTLGAFTDVTGGSRLQRITQNNYKKTDHGKKDNIMEALTTADTSGPPYDNVSRPHRIF